MLPNTIQIESFCYTEHITVSLPAILCLQFERSMAKSGKGKYH